MSNLRSVMRGVLSSYGETCILYRSQIKTTEKHKCRREPAFPIDRMFDVRPEGVVQRDDQWFYFAWNVNPSPGDYVIVEDASSYTGQVVYEISACAPMKGVKGRMEFWHCGARRITPK